MTKIEMIKSWVRPIISIMLVGTACYLAIIGKIPPGQFVTIVAMVVSFHFGERAATKKRQKPDELIEESIKK